MMDVQLLDNAETRDGQASEVIDAEARVGAAGDDQSIYWERRREQGFDKTPWSAYFYYVGKDSGTGDRPLAVYQYVSHHGAIERPTLERLITRLALNAREEDPDKQNPKPFATWFKRTRKSYIIVLVDDPSFVFEKGNAVTMTSDDSGKNHTFFDGADFDIALPAKDGAGMEFVTAVCFTNHMKRNADGDDLLDAELQHFQAQYSPDMKLVSVAPVTLAGGKAMSDGESLRIALEVDDGGTNMGPPVPPP